MRIVATKRELGELGIGPGLPARPIFVPTMGALHDGHVALVRHAARQRTSSTASQPVVVSVFVNPTQFNDPADLARYPRTLEADARACREAGADVIFAPSTEEVYPAASPPRVPPLPAVATEPKLEDAFRPGHFAGVCQVVARLFELVQPVSAIFGEKDWQQLQVIRAMVAAGPAGFARPEIIGLPTVREPDGLAMSSRNVFLSPEERRRAVAVSAALRRAGDSSEREPREAESHMRHTLEAAGLEIQYAVVRDAERLTEPKAGQPKRALIAVRLGSVRLIDNAEWPMPGF